MTHKNIRSWIFKSQNQKINKVVILSFIHTVLGLTAIFFAFYSRETVDSALLNRNQDFLFYAILISSIMLINLIFQSLNHYLRMKYMMEIDMDIKNQMFKKILKTEYVELENYHSGALLTHLELDANHVADGFIDIIPKFIFYIVRFLGAFLLLYLIDSLFALLFIGLGVVLVVSSRLLSKPMKKRHHALQEASETARSFRQEAIEHTLVIKTFEAEEKMSHLQHKNQEMVYQKTMHKHLLSVFVSSGSHIFFSFGYAFAIIFGAFRVQNGLSIGSLVAMIQLVSHIQSPFNGLSMLIPKYFQTLASAERLIKIDQLKEEEINMLDLDLVTFEKLEVSDVCFDYNDDKQVLSNLSFELKKGDFIHLSGDSGKGKTTLFKLILGLLKPKKGDIKFYLGDSILNAGPTTRKLISYVPQELFILSGTIRDNLNIHHTHTDQELYQALKIALLDQDVLELSNKLDTRLKERGQGLSEGQIQRLAIARAILKDTPILLFDEMTSALDLDTEKEIFKQIKNLTDKACIIISHRTIDPTLITKKLELS